MSVFNEYRLIGVCYGDAKIHNCGDKKMRTYFTLAVNSSNGKKKHFIPIVAPNSLAEKAFNRCRNGNIVSVIGEILTSEATDKITGEISISTYFVATDIQLNVYAERMKVSDKNFIDTVSAMPIEHD